MKTKILFGLLSLSGVMLVLMVFLVSILTLSIPVNAAKCGGIETSVFGCNTDDPKEAIFSILGIVINIFTYGVGIAATTGFLLCGYQYITSKSDPGVIVKIKTRILHIVIGLLTYFLFWTVVNFLLPGGVFSQ